MQVLSAPDRSVRRMVMVAAEQLSYAPCAPMVAGFRRERRGAPEERPAEGCERPVVSGVSETSAKRRRVVL